MINLQTHKTKAELTAESLVKFLKKQPKHIGYDRDDLCKEGKISTNQWEHYRLANKLKAHRKMIDGKNYYFNI
jgi:hypothetical protein